MTRPMLSLGIALALALLLTPGVTGQELDRPASADGARVYIIAPSGGEPVASPVKIQFGLSGMGGSNGPLPPHTIDTFVASKSKAGSVSTVTNS